MPKIGMHSNKKLYFSLKGTLILRHIINSHIVLRVNFDSKTFESCIQSSNTWDITLWTLIHRNTHHTWWILFHHCCMCAFFYYPHGYVITSKIAFTNARNVLAYQMNRVLLHVCSVFTCGPQEKNFFGHHSLSPPV